MFEQVNQRDRKSAFRRWLCFFGGVSFIAVVLLVTILAPKLWPAEIPPHMLAKTAPPPPLRTGSPIPPHVKVVNVQREKVSGAPRLAVPYKQFVPPVLTAPRQVPNSIPPAGPPEQMPPEIPGVGQGGPYCVGCVPGPVCVGCIGDNPHFAPPPPPKVVAKEPEPPKLPELPKRIQVGGKVQEALLVRKVMPTYPPLAKQAGVSGLVRMVAVISTSGTIRHLEVVSGHPLLVKAAIEAVSQWVYKPTELNGQPVEVQTQIDVNFVLSR